MVLLMIWVKMRPLPSPAEPGRKAVWEAIWQPGRAPKWMGNDEIPYKNLLFSSKSSQKGVADLFCTDIFFCTHRKCDSYTEIPIA